MDIILPSGYERPRERTPLYYFDRVVPHITAPMRQLRRRWLNELIAAHEEDEESPRKGYLEYWLGRL